MEITIFLLSFFALITWILSWMIDADEGSIVPAIASAILIFILAFEAGEGKIKQKAVDAGVARWEVLIDQSTGKTETNFIWDGE